MSNRYLKGACVFNGCGRKRFSEVHSRGYTCKVYPVSQRHPYWNSNLSVDRSREGIAHHKFVTTAPIVECSIHLGWHLDPDTGQCGWDGSCHVPPMKRDPLPGVVLD